MPEVLGVTLVLHRLSMVVKTAILALRRKARVLLQVHPLLHSKFEASLRHRRRCLVVMVLGRPLIPALAEAGGSL